MKKISLILFLLFSWSVFAHDLKGLNTPLGEIEISNLSRDEGEALFNKFFQEKEFYHLLPKGCEDRAYLVNYYAHKNDDVIMGKIGIMPTDEKYLLSAKSEYMLGETGVLNDPVSWHYHIANVVFVEGELKVFDFTLFEKPVGVEEWLNSLAENKELLHEMQEEDLESFFKYQILWFFTDYTTYHPGEVLRRGVFSSYEDDIVNIAEKNLKEYCREYGI